MIDMRSLLPKAMSIYRKDGSLKLMSEIISFTKSKFSKWWYRKRVLNQRRVVQRPLQPITVDPKQVKYSLLESDQTTYNRRDNNPIPHIIKMEKASFKKQEYGTILSGEWDLYKMRHEDEIIFRGLHNHLVDNQPFDETEYGYIKKMQIELGIQNPSLREFYYNKIFSLIKSLETNGYLSIQQLYDDPKLMDNLDEFDINIGRNGELISNSRNHHRLSLAKILNIDKMSVIVIVRHSNWQAIRKEVRQANSFDKLSNKAKKNIHHPDIKPIVDYDVPRQN